MISQARKITSTVMTLIILLSPSTEVYASQEHNCDPAEMSPAQTHQHTDEDTDHHASQPQSAENTRCVFCADKQCCCDGATCSCMVVTSVFLPAVNEFNITFNYIFSSIPFAYAHHVQPDAAPLLRPPIT
ncbi:MAG: hypothetical protein OQL09_05815 [Gammaproteobacteria bacterium]|nr:hypothetical protein [Gammaproteobacteria bacterium]